MNRLSGAFQGAADLGLHALVGETVSVVRATEQRSIGANEEDPGLVRFDCIAGASILRSGNTAEVTFQVFVDPETDLLDSATLVHDRNDCSVENELRSARHFLFPANRGRTDVVAGACTRI